MIVKAKATAARLAAVIPELPIYRFSVDQYHQMIDLGFLTSPVELIDGWVVPKMPKKPPHVRSSQKVARRIESLLPAGWHLRRQDPITTLDSEPEPDIAVVQGAEEDYGERHPAPTDVGLIVEVSGNRPGREDAHLRPRRHPDLLGSESRRRSTRGLHTTHRPAQEPNLPQEANPPPARLGTVDARRQAPGRHRGVRPAALSTSGFPASPVKVLVNP